MPTALIKVTVKNNRLPECVERDTGTRLCLCCEIPFNDARAPVLVFGAIGWPANGGLLRVTAEPGAIGTETIRVDESKSEDADLVVH